MKKTVLFIAFASLVWSCQSTESPEPISDAGSATEIIDSLVNAWHRAAADADFSTYMGLMDSQSIFIGTDASEYWSKSEFAAFCKPYFDKGKAWSFTPIRRNIYFDATHRVAWFDELLHTWMGTCFGNGVLTHTDRGWKIQHYALSVAIPNDDIQAVIQTKETNDSLFLRSYIQGPEPLE